MAKQESVINFDPINEKKKKGKIARFLITRYSGGKPVRKSEPYGHYMFCGAQGTGKTSSALWYAEKLGRKYKKKRIGYYDDVFNDEGDLISSRYVKFDTPPRIRLYSNFGVGREIVKTKIFDTISAFDPYANEVRIVLLDEIHTYFPKGSADKETQKIRDDLTNIFSQLRKRNTFILSTAQVYGRLDKSLREQCLYMIDCKVSINNRLVNDFIPEKDILCDELGRWAGNPKFIHVHGLSRLEYDTKRIVRE